ncbi:MAG: hypothetical protein K1Y36_00280 [Blastocatellia bacterium]|nr:hypothetical protein [Blastocatellia bacterium]
MTRNLLLWAICLVSCWSVAAQAETDEDLDRAGQTTITGFPAEGLPFEIQTKATKVLAKDLRVMGNPTELPDSAQGEAAATGHSLPGHGQAPVVRVLETDRTLRVGESKTFTFTFEDAENDPLFAGVVGFLPLPARDGVFFSRSRVLVDRSQLGRSIDVEILPSTRPNVIVWRVTALRPGTAALLLVATELFADVKNDRLKLFAGNLSFEPVTLTVTDGAEGAQTPVFDDLPPDLTLRRGESCTWTSTSRTPAARPLTFGYGVLGFAGRILDAKFSDNALRLKAMEAGRAVMFGYVTDGLNIQAFSRRVTVVSAARTATATEPGATQIRALSNNIVSTLSEPNSEPVDVLVFGEGLMAAAQAVIVSERGDQVTTTSFTARTTTLGSFKWKATVPGGHVVWLADASGKQIAPAVRVRSVAVQVTSLLRVRRSPQAPVSALLLRGQGLGYLPTIIVEGRELTVRARRSNRNRLNQRVLVKLPTDLQLRPGLTVQVVTETGLASEPFFVPLS